MEKRMVNGNCHRILDVHNNFSLSFESSSCSTSSSFYKPSKLLTLRTPSPSSYSFSVGLGTCGGGLSYIQHYVSKFDTLAGVAIKYGVEVADIKKLNGLVTDHQMFARKTLYIPSPGRHPPSTVVSDAPDNHGPNSSEQTPPGHIKSDFVESFKLGSSPLRNVSLPMSTVQGYPGLEPVEEKSHSDGLEMAVYRNGGSHAPFTKSAIRSNAPLSHHRKCKSVSYDLGKSIRANQDEAKENGSDKWIESLSQWRKSKDDLTTKPPETLLREEVSSNNGGFSALGSSKGLALRPKTLARVASGPNSGVRKSSSAPILKDSENGTSSSSSSSLLKPRWNLKPDLQNRILDGLPIPYKSVKAALD